MNEEEEQRDGEVNEEEGQRDGEMNEERKQTEDVVDDEEEQGETTLKMKRLYGDKDDKGEKIFLEHEMPMLKLKDCLEIQKNGATASGLYTIYPDSLHAMKVYCDLASEGGGWNVIMRRVDDKYDFPNRTWLEYVDGFGELIGSFWLGNNHIHHLAKIKYKNFMLRIELEDWDGDKKYAEYTEFWIGSEADKFALNVGGYSGTAGDDLSYNNGGMFSTVDEDNDNWGIGHCAVEYHSAWWYKYCGFSQLTGEYLPGRHQKWRQGVRWDGWRGEEYSYKRAEMKIRPY